MPQCHHMSPPASTSRQKTPRYRPTGSRHPVWQAAFEREILRLPEMRISDAAPGQHWKMLKLPHDEIQSPLDAVKAPRHETDPAPPRCPNGL